MKIAFVLINANRFEGTSRAILEVAERLASDYDVDLWARTIGDVDQACVHWRSVPGPRRPEIADFASFRWLVDRRLAREKYDIIHTAGPNTSYADVYTIQTVHPVKMQQIAAQRNQSRVSWLRRLSWRVYDRAVLRAERCDYSTPLNGRTRMFLPVSEGTRCELLGCYPKCDPAGQSVRVIPNGADLSLFHPYNRQQYREPIRQRHSLDANDFVVVFTGGDWRRKGLDLLLRAMALIDEPTIKLLVVGHDRAGQEVRELADALALQHRVCFAGFCKQPEQYYAASDLFVFPTSYEAFSVASIEAAASGLPVLMSQVSGAQELVGDGSCGSIVERSPQAIANAILEYYKNPPRLHQESHAARMKAEREFSWDAVTSQTLDAYRSLLESRAQVGR